MSRINFDQLTAFLTVVRLGGARRAAEALNLTQPAITSRIRNLEKMVGVELFERTGGGMRPTKRGEMLVSYAERFEQLSGLMERDVVDPSGIEGRLRLGVSETVAECWLPDLIYRLHGLYPAIEVELNVDVSLNLRNGLLDRGIDLAVLLGPVSEYTVENIDLPSFDLAWYAAASAPKCDDPADYLRRPVLTYARNTRPYREIKRLLFESVGAESSIFPSSSLSACFKLVEADLGVAALPRALGQALVAAGRIREFDPGWTPSPLCFTASYLAEPSSPIAETTANLAAEVAKEYMIDKKF